ncbi:MAG TPA: phosphotransferase family protein [Dehalococcoidia bacterium]|jgi:aminoglycoside phosphotransferase (APT) family kinase protein|nr:phosphotransferase family protein [Dehalococcoidia bacterium]
MLEERIQAYLSQKLAHSDDVAVSDLHRIAGGASRETWSFDATWREDGREVRRGFILRRDPDASLLETDRDTEFRVMDAVAACGVPVPKMYWLENDGGALDRPFFLMERIDGCETSPTKVLMDPRFFAARERLAQQFVDVLARIHAFDWRAAGLDSLGVPANEAECGMREIENWEAVVNRDALEPQPVLRAAFRWLRRHLPPPAQRLVLVHADYRTGNFLCDGAGEIKGVLDWEMTHIGDPIEDVAWACIRPWRWLGDEKIGGLLDREDFFRGYERAGGFTIDVEAVRFWEVLGNAKLAAIFLTGARSFCDGRTRSPMMAFLGRNIGRLELEIMDLIGV